ncbi:MAG: hypothetical protein LAN71_03950 [Acidobacteriia bacterium]|nr:hypothetical protein [Terriglobia bacterium]
MRAIRGMDWLMWAAASLAIALGGTQARAQKPEEKPAQKQAPMTEPGESSSKRPLEEGETRITPGEAKVPVQPKYDPLRAEKDVEVGQHYMRIHQYDAAIDRFKDAIDARPTYALPYKLLGEAQEKRKFYRAAIESYESYLEIFPHAGDAGKVRKRIEKLKGELEKRRR